VAYWVSKWKGGRGELQLESWEENKWHQWWHHKSNRTR